MTLTLRSYGNSTALQYKQSRQAVNILPYPLRVVVVYIYIDIHEVLGGGFRSLRHAEDWVPETIVRG